MPELSKTTLRTLDILEFLVRAEKPLSLNEITRITGKNKTAVFRSLQTLVYKKYLAQDEDTNKYYITLKLSTLGREVMQRIDLGEILFPFMKDLVEEINLSAHCSTREGAEIVFIYNVDPPSGDFKISFDLGRRSPIYCTAAGKVFLACMPIEEREKLLATLNLQQYTNNTITDQSKLQKELELIHKRGYAIDNEEHNQGIMCVGAPIKDYYSNVNTVISVIGLASSIKSKGVHKLGNIIKEKAQQISLKMTSDQ
jgi:IclR family transcriptional regulator, KDG regulon repressor